MQQSRHGSTFIFGFMAIGVLLAGAAPAAELASGHGHHAAQPGGYYATPSWNQKLPASKRFLVLSDWNSEAVLDRETGLVWERSPSSPIGGGWRNGIEHCVNLTKGGRKGWRLPTIAELTSLIDPSVPSEGNPPPPSLPPGHPFLNVDTPAGASLIFWSASTHADDPTLVWVMGLDSGGGAQYGPKLPIFPTPGSAWCVRGGMQEGAH